LIAPVVVVSRDARSGLRPAEDKRTDVVPTLAPVRRFTVHVAPDEIELARHSVAAGHVARDTRDVEGSAAR